MRYLCHHVFRAESRVCARVRQPACSPGAAESRDRATSNHESEDEERTLLRAVTGTRHTSEQRRLHTQSQCTQESHSNSSIYLITLVLINTDTNVRSICPPVQLTRFALPWSYLHLRSTYGWTRIWLYTERQEREK